MIAYEVHVARDFVCFLVDVSDANIKSLLLSR